METDFQFDFHFLSLNMGHFNSLGIAITMQLIFVGSTLHKAVVILESLTVAYKM